MPGRTVWFDTLVNLVATNGSGASALSLHSELNRDEQRLSGMTLLRTIVGLDIAHQIHDSGEGSQLVDLGIGIASQEAFSADVVPDPNTSTEHPPRGWVWRYRCRTYGFAADQAAVYNHRVDKDIRARRRLENGELFLRIFNITDQGVAGNIVVHGLIRTLWLIT